MAFVDPLWCCAGSREGLIVDARPYDESMKLAYPEVRVIARIWRSIADEAILYGVDKGII